MRSQFKLERRFKLRIVNYAKRFGMTNMSTMGAVRRNIGVLNLLPKTVRITNADPNLVWPRL